MMKQYTESRFGISGAWGRASISHFQWGQAEGGKPVVLSQSNGSIYRPRMDFDAIVLGVFMSSTLKI
jgi:hypothetical protein